ncbi:hypothetical protein D3029_23415 [Escherichia coli]|nr:hypothetical protein [Escherichia coli]EFN9261414.1 hypothetical protein [Escherichia coli]
MPDAGRYCKLSLSEKRMRGLINGDRDSALNMGLIDKICDFFRPEKKADVLAQIWTMMNPEDSQVQPVTIRDKFKVQLEAFQTLVSMVDKDALDIVNNGVNPLSLTCVSSRGPGSDMEFRFCFKGEIFIRVPLRWDDLKNQGNEVTDLNLAGCKFNNVALIGNFRNVNFTNCSFSNGVIKFITFHNCPLSGVSFSDCNMSKIIISADKVAPELRTETDGNLIVINNYNVFSFSCETVTVQNITFRGGLPALRGEGITYPGCRVELPQIPSTIDMNTPGFGRVERIALTDRVLDGIHDVGFWRLGYILEDKAPDTITGELPLVYRFNHKDNRITKGREDICITGWHLLVYDFVSGEEENRPTVPEFFEASRTKYATRIEGADGDWALSGRKFANKPASSSV